MIIADTHTLVWYIDNSPLLSRKAKRLLNRAREEKTFYVSSISIWEIGTLVKKKRLSFDIPATQWIKEIEKLSFLQFVPVDNDIAWESTRLPEPVHKDPADRIIITTAYKLGIPIVSKDDKIRKYSHTESIW